MRNNNYLNKITENTKFIKELDELLKDSAKIYINNSSLSFMDNLILSIHKKMNDYPFFKNFSFSISEEFEGGLTIQSNFPEKKYEPYLKSISFKIDNLIDITSKHYYVSNMIINQNLYDNFSSVISYDLSFSKFEQKDNWFFFNNDEYKLSFFFETTSPFDIVLNNCNINNEQKIPEKYIKLIDFFSNLDPKKSNIELNSLLLASFFNKNFINQDDLEYYMILEDIDLSFINEFNDIFIDIENFNLDTVYHNITQNKKNFKH